MFEKSRGVSFLGEPKSSTFRVASYNLHGETNGWGPDRFLPCDYSEELAGFHADVLVLPEVWRPTEGRTATSEDGSLVIRWLTDNEFNWVSARASVCTPRKAKLAEDVDAHVVLATKHEIVERKEFHFPKHPKDTSTNRNCVAALIDVPVFGKIWVVGVHLSANVPWAPVNNVFELKKFILELEQGPHPVIVAGDFNLWGWWVRSILRNGHRRAATGRTWPAWAPHSQIDHILYTDSMKLEKAEVLPAGHSDHRGIYADFKSERELLAPYKISPPEQP